MAQAKIVKAPPSGRGSFVTTTKNTDISQRATLEEVIVNLSSVLGVELVYKQENSRGGYFYEIRAHGFSGFQSASNTILELSRRLAGGSKA